ncbi:TPA: hypothetical protein DD449_01610 [Candidatus Berkelbacteria bacterium]|nr:hypothetical protein [Candidatus Berkelbacteria bacterium]
MNSNSTTSESAIRIVISPSKAPSEPWFSDNGWKKIRCVVGKEPVTPGQPLYAILLYAEGKEWFIGSVCEDHVDSSEIGKLGIELQIEQLNKQMKAIEAEKVQLAHFAEELSAFPPNIVKHKGSHFDGFIR